MAKGVVTGQETDYGEQGGQRISYGVAFNAPIAKPPAAKPGAKER